MSQYTEEQILESVLILHPKMLDRYNITRDKFYDVFEEWSNFTQLSNPILDRFWNEFCDSEWLYYAQRFSNLQVKELISFCSLWHWLSKKAAYLHEDEMDKNDENRIMYMREAIKQKFNNNPELRQKLIETWTREIIEFTYWWDVFFWIYSKTLEGRNILGKLLMEYRDSL